MTRKQAREQLANRFACWGLVDPPFQAEKHIVALEVLGLVRFDPEPPVTPEAEAISLMQDCAVTVGNHRNLPADLHNQAGYLTELTAERLVHFILGKGFRIVRATP